MVKLPITRMTLYKHGVGFFERRAELSAERVELSFRVEEMNDILKSLTAIDWGGGRVLGIDYATPQSREERLAGCSIRLGDDRSLQDLLVGLRGRRVTLQLDQGEATTGTLVGLDEAPERRPLAGALVSLLADGDERVHTVSLGRVQGVEILDERGAGDLRFFLKTSLSQEAFRNVTVRLTPGEHDLSVSYIAPAPTWRVSYRLVAEADAGVKGRGRALLQGWGIFDNRLEEDLEGIALSLVAGMPISFVYDLYTPFTPERPVVEEEARVAAAPVAFGAAHPKAAEADLAARMPEARAPSPMAMGAAMGIGMDVARQRSARIDIDAVQQAAEVQTTGAALGELFQYNIGTPVTVGRGQSAMVPIVQSALTYRKDLIYNGRKMAVHPVATMRLKNESDLTLERGPVTVLEGGDYVGEALLPFTVVGAEIVVPYAVELGVKVREESGSSREVRGLQIQGAYLRFEEWEVRSRTYTLTNSTGKATVVLVEHPRLAGMTIFDTPEPREHTDNEVRFEVEVPPQGEATLKVRERRLTWRHEEIQRQSYSGLQDYLKRGLLKPRDLEKLTQLLKLWEQVADQEKRVSDLQGERDRIRQTQQQIQGNMQVLGQTGKEGDLRTQYVEQLEATEAQLRKLDADEAQVRAEIARLKEQIDAQLKKLA